MTQAIVIGAGAAGLRAAVALRKAGKDVLVLEARERIGGRIHTVEDREAGTTIELGAEFVHGEVGELKRSRLRLEEMAGRHLAHVDGSLRDVTKEMFGMLGQLAKASGAGTAQSWLARSELPPLGRELARHYIEGFFAAPAAFVSIADIANEQAVRNRRVLGGYDRALRPLADSLREDSALRLGTVVTEVRWRKGHVEVKARTRTGRELAPFEAQKLVVSLPIGVLLARPGQEGAVRFDPPLQRKREALSWVRMGSVVKAVLRFREPIWAWKQIRKADFIHAPGAPFPTWWRAGPPDLPVVIGWAGGPAASKLAKGDPLPAAVVSLARVLGRSASDLEGLLESATIADWGRDPYSRGAYAYHLAEAPPTTTAELAASEEDTIFFAGEATSLIERAGTVDGALESGARAAKEVLAKR
jgi:monoamine oxidase